MVVKAIAGILLAAVLFLVLRSAAVKRGARRAPPPPPPQHPGQFPLTSAQAGTLAAIFGTAPDSQTTGHVSHILGDGGLREIANHNPWDIAAAIRPDGSVNYAELDATKVAYASMPEVLDPGDFERDHVEY